MHIKRGRPYAGGFSEGQGFIASGTCFRTGGAGGVLLGWFCTKTRRHLGLNRCVPILLGLQWSMCADKHVSAIVSPSVAASTDPPRCREEGEQQGAAAWRGRRGVLGGCGWCWPLVLGYVGSAEGRDAGTRGVPPVVSLWELRYLTEIWVPPSAEGEKSDDCEEGCDGVAVTTRALKARFGGDGEF